MDAMSYFDIIRYPREHMAKALKKVDMGEAVKSFALAGAVWGLLAGLVFAFLGTFFGALVGSESAGLGAVLAGLGMLSLIVLPIAAAVMAVLGGAIGYGVIWFGSNLLGGKGTFEQLFYLGSRLVWPLLIAGVVVNILTLIPILGWLIQLAWGVYTVYLLTTLVSVASKLSMLKSFAAIILPWVVLVVAIAFLVALVIR